MEKKKITLLDIKSSLRDERFRNSLPEEMKNDIHEYLKNPSCPCNLPFYRKILINCQKQLIDYFPNRELPNIEQEIQKLSENHWTVINCKVDELEQKLKKLPNGRKQISMARWENQVTILINELDVLW
jgi:hypothetical protein